MLSSKRELFSETSYLGDSSSLRVFPLSLYIGSLTEVTQTCHAVNSLRQQRQPVASVFSRMMNSENAPKSMSHKITSGKTPSKFAILYCVKPSDCRFVIWFMPFLKFDLPRLSFEVFQLKSELF